MTHDTLARKLCANAETGLTIGLDGTQVHQGFAVGREGWEMRLSQPLVLNSWFAVREWVQTVLTVHEIHYAKSDWALGVWRDGDKVYFDVVNVVADRDEALAMGRAHNQLAIYDLAKGEEIRLDDCTGCEHAAVGKCPVSEDDEATCPTAAAVDNGPCDTCDEDRKACWGCKHRT